MNYLLSEKIKEMPGRILILYLLLFTASHAFTCSPPVKRKTPKVMTTSVAIPCCGKHFQLLYPLLQSYSTQTVVPDEVVISLSDVEQLYKESVDRLDKYAWPFPLKIIRKEGRESAGQNRNIAAEHCKNDV